MAQSLADVLVHLNPLIDGAFSSHARERLDAMAQVLPPVVCGGFEFSLLDRSAPVDLQQFFSFDQTGRAQLRAFVERTGHAADEPWRWLRWLCAAPYPNEILSGVRGVWIELDSATFDRANPQVSIFLEFDDAVPLSPAALSGILDSMPLSARDAKHDALRRVLAAAPPGARISHLGAMFSRADTPLRINVKRVRSGAVVAFAQNLGLHVDAGPAAALAAQAYRSTLCLDVTSTLHARLGVEFSFTAWPSREHCWRILAARAAGREPDADVWSAFEGWDRVVTPLDTPHDWPDPLILAEMAGPSDRWSVIQCGPSHLKATFSPLHSTTLKAYVGFRAAWRTRDGDIVPESLRLPTPKSAPVACTGAVTDSALAFLLAQRTQDGLWRDFDFANLHSDEWVSGYIGAHLLELGEARGRDAAARAWQLLRDRRPPGHGWGYQQLTQPDADSTAWVLLLAQRLGFSDDPVVLANTVFLRDHLGDDGAVRTYSNELLAGMSASLPESEAHVAWHGTHGEVTASAAFAGITEALDNLLQTQCDDGSWDVFWTDDRAYSTGLACEALARHRSETAHHALGAAGRWAIARLETEQSVFGTAWLIRAALAAGGDEGRMAIAAAVQRLVGLQQGDGAWDGSCALRIPVMDATGADVIAVHSRDVHRSFTCATALVALHRARQAGFELKA